MVKLRISQCERCKLSANVLLVLVFVLSYLGCTSSANTFDDLNDFMKMSGEEKTPLDKFPPLLRPFLRNNNLRNDFNLLRWLRTKNQNFRQAQNGLRENLRWRRHHHNIDTIINDDVSGDMDGYPITYAHDKEGRPVAGLPIGSWNLRKAVLSGKMPRLIRYMTNLLEVNRNKVLDSMGRGGNGTQFKIIANMDGYNPIQHGCPVCMLAYTSFIRTVQNRLSGNMNQFILVNTPPTFKAVLDTIKPLLSARTRRTLKVFGRNKAEWMEYLQKDISKDELARVI